MRATGSTSSGKASLAKFNRLSIFENGEAFVGHVGGDDQRRHLHRPRRHLRQRPQQRARRCSQWLSAASSIGTLTSLDYLGYGLPPGSASLGELVQQGKNNLQAPWLGISIFLLSSVMLTLLIFIGEAVRDALDPRKTFT